MALTTTVVRAAGPADWQSMRDVRLAALRTDPQAFTSTWERESARTPTERQAWPRSGVVFAAWQPGTEGEQAVGMVGIFVDADEPDLADLWGMWVAPAVRGTGAAGQLIESAVAWAGQQGCAGVALEVAAGNERARRAYERHGFAVVGPATACVGGVAMQRACA
jgi:RimJ/RimL family protein N-acetyltransferase